MVSTVISINLIKKGRFIAEQFLLPEKLLIEKINTGKFTLKPISKIGKVRGGKRLPSNSRYVLEGILIPYVRSTDIKELGIDLENVVFISPEQEKFISRYPLKYLDVVISIAGTIGTVGVIDKYIEPCYFNENLARITEINELNPLYLAVYLDSKFGQAYIKFFTGGAVQPKLSIESINKIAVPCPPAYVQDRIAQLMQDAYAQKQNKLSEVERLYQIIDNYVFSKLGISLDKVEEKKHFLKPIAEMYKSRFDVDFNMGFHKFDPYMNQVLPVKAVAKFPKRMRELSKNPEAVFQYIDIASIDIQLGEIERAIQITEANAPSRARQVVQTGDIIVSTVRPTRGAIALIPNEMEGFICSTGFTIIHPTEKVSSAYLHLALRLSTTREQFRRRSAGSSYPAILENDIKETLIPVPDKKIQTEIATEVTQVYKQAKNLLAEAENLVFETKARVERMILGEEEVT
jgi:type I restriction enzyme, S subunit